MWLGSGMSTLAGAGLFLLQILIMPLLCGIFMARAAAVSRTDRTAFILYGLGLWPAMTALAVDLALRFLPGLPRQAYLAAYTVTVATIVCGALWALLRDEPGSEAAGPGRLRRLVATWKALSPYARAALGIVTVICLFFLIQNLSEPLTGNDAIVHTMVARIISRDMSAAAYPLATADPVTGFLLEGVHPLGFPASKAVFMILLGDLDTPWHKPLTTAYFVYLLLAVGTLSGRLFGTAAAAFAALIVAATPLLLHSVATAHIDPLRLHGFFLCFAMLAEFARRGDRQWLLLGALAFIEALHSHAGNLMLLGFLGPLFLVAAQGPIWKRIVLGAALGLPALILVSPQFIVNQRTYGALLGVDYALERLNPEPFLRWIDIQRSLVTLPDILWNGALAPLSDPGWFAIGFWLGLCGIALACIKGRHRDRPVLILIGALVIYAAIMCLAVATRSKSFYMNTRYMLVMLPLVAVFGGYLFHFLLEAEKKALAGRTLSGNVAAANAPRPVLTGIEQILIAFFVTPIFIALYQVLLPYAREAVLLFGLVSQYEGNEGAVAMAANLALAPPVLLLSWSAWLAARRLWSGGPGPTASSRPLTWAELVKPEFILQRLRKALAFLSTLVILAPIGLFILPPLIRIYGGFEALGIRTLINASKGGSRSLVGLALLILVALPLFRRWQTGHFPSLFSHRFAYPLFILYALASLGYALVPDLAAELAATGTALRQLLPTLDTSLLQALIMLVTAAFSGAVVWLIQFGTRRLWKRRLVMLSWAARSYRRLTAWLRSRLPSGYGYATISYLFVPLLLANLYYGLGSLRSLIHPLYMKPSLIFLSDAAKADASRQTGGGIEYFEPSLYLRDLARTDQGPQIRTLTFRDAEIFAYGGGTIFSNYDPRIWDLYATKTAEEAHRLLLQKGINHLYMPNYSSPTNNLNGVGELLARRDLVRIARQSEGSVFTLFEVAREAGRVDAEEIYRGKLPAPLPLERRAFSMFPAGLSRCDGLRTVHGGIFGWYWGQIVLRMTRTSCLDAYADENWLLLPPAAEGDVYRLEADMTAVGCAGLRVLHRIPPDQPGGDYTVASSDFMHFALKPSEKAALWFQRPARSDAIAVGFYGGCGQPSAISAFHIERLRETSQ